MCYESAKTVMFRSWLIFVNFILVVNCVNYSDSFGTCLKPPRFISNWTDITAHDSFLSEITISHGLGELPAKVDVQVKPVLPDGSVDAFIFPGIGSAQRDDDINATYGGVVYIYNETTVTLIVPNMVNGFDTGQVVYTGDGVWSGSAMRRSKKGKVRVRVWAEDDFPPPHFESNWINIHSGQVDGSYREINHNLKTNPEYVSVQVRYPSTNETSDGVGSGTGFDNPTKGISWGGVLHGYDSNKFRIWLPNRNSGSLFSASDGWGNTDRKWTNGKLRVRAWKQISDQTVHTAFGVKSNATNETLQTSMIHNETLNIDKDIFEMKVKPHTGPNKNIYFLGTGAAQNSALNQTYGGFMYAYSQYEIRMYHPPFPVLKKADGYLLDISPIWGNGSNTQRTNDVGIYVRLTRPSSVCPTTTTTTTTTTTATTPTTTTSITTTTPTTTTTAATRTTKSTPKPIRPSPTAKPPIPVLSRPITTTTVTTATHTTTPAASAISTTQIITTSPKIQTTSTNSPTPVPHAGSTSKHIADSASGGLSAGAGAGIGIGVAAVLLSTLACLVWALLKRKRKKGNAVEDAADDAEEKEKTETKEDIKQNEAVEENKNENAKKLNDVADAEQANGNITEHKE